MQNPLKKDDFHDSKVGCGTTAIGGMLVVLGILASLGGVALYGVVEFLARV